MKKGKKGMKKRAEEYLISRKFFDSNQNSVIFFGEAKIYDVILELFSLTKDNQPEFVILDYKIPRIILIKESKNIKVKDVESCEIRICFSKQELLSISSDILQRVADNSCGSCVPCRELNFRILEAVKNYRVDKDEILTLFNLKKTCEYLEDTCACDYGKSAINSASKLLEILIQNH